MPGINVAQPVLHRVTWRRFEVPFPALGTQRKIAAILSAYDELIENNRRRIKILEEMAQRIYREWFVEFRYPGHENVPLVDSELGPIPQGWTVRSTVVFDLRRLIGRSRAAFRLPSYADAVPI